MMEEQKGIVLRIRKIAIIYIVLSFVLPIPFVLTLLEMFNILQKGFILDLIFGSLGIVYLVLFVLLLINYGKIDSKYRNQVSNSAYILLILSILLSILGIIGAFLMLANLKQIEKNIDLEQTQTEKNIFQ